MDRGHGSSWVNRGAVAVTVTSRRRASLRDFGSESALRPAAAACGSESLASAGRGPAGLTGRLPGPGLPLRPDGRPSHGALAIRLAPWPRTVTASVVGPSVGDRLRAPSVTASTELGLRLRVVMPVRRRPLAAAAAAVTVRAESRSLRLHCQCQWPGQCQCPGNAGSLALGRDCDRGPGGRRRSVGHGPGSPANRDCPTVRCDS